MHFGYPTVDQPRATEPASPPQSKPTGTKNTLARRNISVCPDETREPLLIRTGEMTYEELEMMILSTDGSEVERRRRDEGHRRRQ